LKGYLPNSRSGGSGRTLGKGCSILDSPGILRGIDRPGGGLRVGWDGGGISPSCAPRGIGTPRGGVDQRTVRVMLQVTQRLEEGWLQPKAKATTGGLPRPNWLMRQRQMNPVHYSSGAPQRRKIQLIKALSSGQASIAMVRSWPLKIALAWMILL